MVCTTMFVAWNTDCEQEQEYLCSKSERWSTTSDETILQSGCEFISLSCSVDGLPAC
ncbi:hypothetical protein RchiOBHm_Chr5g0077501 [Rosa chinensis]|uniref:Uncharacterized protein n=1 Tax=Rosa chinensis TaxID=74649 RepID=A0A2P6QLZ2_ROSCH|nr:hypothetical protein RchiOBHm_Chr5g0077501 [Rosa chinensis]